ncbi:hypothetical protein GF337_09885, partial [candidate division KSB1 bacterium]|nr:hypothetical protein [candidate division KSB1 bacterium]
MKSAKLFATTVFGVILLMTEILSAGTISGTVTGKNGEPLAYANVFLQGRMEGAVTNADGKFTIKTGATGVVKLICSFIGYVQYSKELELTPDSDIRLDIKMRQTEIRGESVVVTASAFTASDEEGVTLTSLDVVRTPGAAADLFWAIKSFPGLQ